MTTPGTFSVTPVLDKRELLRLNMAVQRAGKEAQKELKSQLRKVGQVFRTEVGQRIESEFKPGTGRLKRSTRIQVDIRNNTFKVEVRNTARKVSRKYPQGYLYGKKQEFKLGHPFWYPTWDALKYRLKDMFDEVLEKAYKAFVKG